MRERPRAVSVQKTAQKRGTPSALGALLTGMMLASGAGLFSLTEVNLSGRRPDALVFGEGRVEALIEAKGGRLARLGDAESQWRGSFSGRRVFVAVSQRHYSRPFIKAAGSSMGWEVYVGTIPYDLPEDFLQKLAHALEKAFKGVGRGDIPPEVRAEILGPGLREEDLPRALALREVAVLLARALEDRGLVIKGDKRAAPHVRVGREERSWILTVWWGSEKAVKERHSSLPQKGVGELGKDEAVEEGFILVMRDEEVSDFLSLVQAQLTVVLSPGWRV